MAEELLGCWKLVSSDNFDGYLKELGVNMATRMFVGTLKPEVHICKNGDKWSIKTVSSFQTTDVCFKLNEEFSEITPDKRKCKITVTLDNNGLKETQKWDDKETTITRTVENGQMITICKCGDVTCRRVYTRA